MEFFFEPCGNPESNVNNFFSFTIISSGTGIYFPGSGNLYVYKACKLGRRRGEVTQGTRIQHRVSLQHCPRRLPSGGRQVIIKRLMSNYLVGCEHYVCHYHQRIHDIYDATWGLKLCLAALHCLLISSFGRIQTCCELACVVGCISFYCNVCGVSCVIQ